MTRYEQELRKLFDASGLMDRPQYSGRVCVQALRCRMSTQIWQKKESKPSWKKLRDPAAVRQKGLR